MTRSLNDFDFEKMEFWNGNRALDLSKTEQRLLHCLIENRGWNVSRSQLIDTVWHGDTELVDGHSIFYPKRVLPFESNSKNAG